MSQWGVFKKVFGMVLVLVAGICAWKLRPEWAAVFIGWAILFRLDEIVGSR